MSWLQGLWMGLNEYYDALCPNVYPYSFPALASSVLFCAMTVVRIVDSEESICKNLIERHGKRKGAFYGLLFKLVNVLVFYSVSLMIANQTEHNLAVGIIVAAVLFGGWYVIKWLGKFLDRKASKKTEQHTKRG